MTEVPRGIKPTETHKNAACTELKQTQKYVEQHKARLAAMTPQEREERAKRDAEHERKWDSYKTPEGQKEFVVFFVRSMKKQGKLPPDLDHLWLNLPSGWAEYREVPAKEGEKEPSHTVTLGTAPTQEQWDEYYPALQAKMKAWKAEKARQEAVKLHAGDPRYDPMTGDLLKSDEFPLNPKSEYTFYGKTRARSFVHPEARSFLSPDNPLLKQRKYLQSNGKQEVQESESNERLVKRLLKAGFVEVEPTLADEAQFERIEWYRSLSSAEKIQYLQECMREMRGEASLKQDAKDTTGDKFTRFTELLNRLFLAILFPNLADWEEEEVSE